MRRWSHGTGACAAAGLCLAVGREVDRFEPGRVGQARDAPPLGDRLTVDLLDVPGEVDRRGAADVRPDGVRVDRRAGVLEVPDALRVEAARDGDLDVMEARLVEPG